MFLRLVPSYFLIVYSLSCVYMLHWTVLNFLSYVTIIFFLHKSSISNLSNMIYII
jgi:hypothetical protein